MRNWELYLCELLNPKTLTFGDLVSHVESDLDVIQVPEASLLRILGSIYPRIKANRKSWDFGIPKFPREYRKFKLLTLWFDSPE